MGSALAAAGGEPERGERDSEENGARRDEGGRIEERDFVELTRDQPTDGNRPKDAERQADCNWPRPVRV